MEHYGTAFIFERKIMEVNRPCFPYLWNHHRGLNIHPLRGESANLKILYEYLEDHPESLMASAEPSAKTPNTYGWTILGLVGGIPTPLKNMTSSVGMIIPNIWKNNPNVPVTTNQWCLTKVSGVDHNVYCLIIPWWKSLCNDIPRLNVGWKIHHESLDVQRATKLQRKLHWVWGFPTYFPPLTPESTIGPW